MTSEATALELFSFAVTEAIRDMTPEQRRDLAVGGYLDIQGAQ